MARNRPIRRLWSFQVRAGTVFCWIVACVVVLMTIRTVLDRGHGAAGVAVVLGVSVPGHLVFWSIYRLRVDVFPDRLVVVGPFWKTRLRRDEIDRAEIGRGGLVGEMLVLVTRQESVVRVPAFQAFGSFGGDSMAFRDMAGARYEINQWLDRGESRPAP